MIFNPLFINETGNSQSLVSKPGKLAKNKYLFSDIVKVVMNPGEQKEDNSLGEVSELKQSLLNSSEQETVELKNVTLSEEDNEKAKLDLADILPEEISHLLIKDEMLVNDESVVSYISKEPLNGELKTFLNGLVGEELIEKNIGQDSGILLNLEDKKSAVNIELIQGKQTKSSKDNIIVQTLVVPEKAKLFSLFQNPENQLASLKQKNTTETPIAPKINLKQKEQQLNNVNTKPTLSVYSFKNNNENIEQITNHSKLNLNTVNISSLNKIKSDYKNKESAKIPLEKISFARNELNSNESIKVQDGINKIKFVNINNELSNTVELKNEAQKDYSVKKITIVKKNNDQKLTINDLSKSTKAITPELKRIDFYQKPIEEKSNLKIYKTTDSKQKNIDTKNSKNKEVVTKKVYTQNLVSDIKSKNNDQTKIEKNNQETNLLKNIKVNSETINENKKEEKIELKTEKLSTPKLDSKTSELKTEVNKVVKNSESKNIEIQRTEIGNVKANTDISKTVLTSKVAIDKLQKEIEILNEKIENYSESESKTTSTSENENKKVRISVSENKRESIKVEPNKASDNKKQVISNEKVNYEQPKNELKTELQNADSKSQNQVKSNYDEVEKTTNKVSSKQIEYSANNGTTVQLNSHEIQKINTNKKLSVKVKREIKTINNKNGAQSEIAKEELLKANNISSNQNGSDNDFTNEDAKNLFSSNNNIDLKHGHENNFQKMLSREEISKIENAIPLSPEIDEKSGQKIVKSIEVIKEISKFISKQEKGSLSFDINPKDLGRMKITLDTVEHALKATIEVDNEQSKQLIEKNIGKLQTQLNENGVQLNSLDISLSNSKHQSEKPEVEGKEKRNSEQFNQEEEEKKEKSKSLGYNTYEYIA